MKTLRTLLAALLLTLTAAHAGTFSTAAWTNDASTGIAAGPMLWAYHFGSTAACTINGVTVAGRNTATVSNANFDLTGPTSIFNNDTNNVTGAGSSAVMAKDFIYGGNPATVTVKGLTPGRGYTVSFFSVGWVANQTRVQTFASGMDAAVIDQQQFGEDNGLRVDYTFTATAATQAITISPMPATQSNTWHLYGLALRFSETIPNPSFEANTFTTFPGNAVDNGGITGWSAVGSVGLNPVGGQNPLYDNGAVPQGANVAFLQSVNRPLEPFFNNGVSTLSTTLTGLVPGTGYVVSFRANRRSATGAPAPDWSLNGGPFIPFKADPAVEAAGSFNNPFRLIRGGFIATATTAALVIRNQTAGVNPAISDSTVLVDDFLIKPRTPLVVTTAADSGTGSLRAQMTAAAAEPGGELDLITFAPALNGQTITLASDIVVNDSGGVIVDASALPAGVTVSGAGQFRIFTVSSGSKLQLSDLTLRDGGANSTFDSNLV